MGAKVTVALNGFKLAKISRPPQARGDRAKVTGWTKAAANGNRDFLWSIDTSGFGSQRPTSFTLTLRDCPPTVEEWKNLIRNLRLRLNRFGVRAVHYCVEWHMRGRYGGGAVPHLHGMALSDEPEELARFVIQAWLEIAKPYGVTIRAQDAKVIWSAPNWLEYLGKHCSRGVAHYQRNADCMPKLWESTGRLWGQWGDWPRREAKAYKIDDADFFQVRRFVKRYEIAKARAYAEKHSGEKRAVLFKAVAFKRRILKRNDQDIAKIVPMSSWINHGIIETYLSTIPKVPHFKPPPRPKFETEETDAAKVYKLGKFNIPVRKPAEASEV